MILSNIPIQLKKGRHLPNTASLDRIDNSKGYIKGNIRWVSRSINYMKNDMSDDMVNELIDLIVKNKKGSN